MENKDYLMNEIDELEKGSTYDVQELVKKVNILIEYINSTTKTFSINRMNLINKLNEKMK